MDVAEIAKGLTKAQREALTGHNSWRIRTTTSAPCRCALQRKGLVVDRMYAESFTPLGLAVRKHLLENPHG